MEDPYNSASLNLALATCTLFYKTYKIYAHCKNSSATEKKVAPDDKDDKDAIN